MKSLIVALCVVACAFAAAVDERLAETIKNDYEINPDGTFQFAVETNNGISASARGTLKQVDKEVALQIEGANQYQSPEGQNIQLSYIADENGYQPQGAHLPTPPPPEPIPSYILRALEYIAAHPNQDKRQL